MNTNESVWIAKKGNLWDTAEIVFATPPRWNAECGMRNAECGMRNAECGMRNCSAQSIPHSAFLLFRIRLGRLFRAAGGQCCL